MSTTLRVAIFSAAVVFLSATQGSAEGQADRLRVCSVTINSNDEIETFRRHLPDSSFDFVELTDFARESTVEPDKSWFGRACQSGVKCDVLVLSGHFSDEYFGSFGTTFAGDSGMSLSLEELEQRSCDQSCPGILGNPLEVFLFGCRTLGRSLAERPLPNGDKDLLARHGVPPAIAELVIEELRFRGDDTSNRERMRFVFSDVPHLYGFVEAAPVGPDVRPRLEKYLRSKRDYAAYLRKEAAARGKPTTNRDLARAIQPSTFTQCSGLDRADPAYERGSRMCFLKSDTNAAQVRLDYLEKLFAEPGFFSYLPAIAMFLQSHPPGSSGPEERAAIERIQKMDEPRKAAVELVQGLQTPLLRLEVVRVARTLGWVADDESLRVQREIALGYLHPPTYGEGRDAICSMAPDVVKRIDLRLEEVPDKAYEDEYAIQALGCLKPADERIHARLGRSLSDPRDWIARLAAKALGDIKPAGIEVQAALAEQLKRPEEGPRQGAAAALRELKPSDPGVLEAIRKNDPTFAIDWQSAPLGS